MKNQDYAERVVKEALKEKLKKLVMGGKQHVDYLVPLDIPGHEFLGFAG